MQHICFALEIYMSVAVVPRYEDFVISAWYILCSNYYFGESATLH
jgi:hypothetical protein